MRAAGRGSAVLVRSAAHPCRSNDVEYPYRQNSDFAYLTGLSEIDALAVFIPGGEDAEYILFYTPRTRAEAVWEGASPSLHTLRKNYAVERVYPTAQFEEIFPCLLMGKKRLYCSLDQAGVGEDAIKIVRALRRVRRPRTSLDEIIALETLTHPLRLRKSAYELRLLKRAVDAAVISHEKNMRLCRPGLSERDLEAQILETLCSQGMAPSYPPIVAGGARACILHYTKNNGLLRPHQMLLVDAGAEYRLYASDITRTYPVNGRFRSHQRELYEVVLEAQAAAIQRVRPGSCWSEVYEAAVLALVRGLRSLNILKGTVPSLVRKKAYHPYFMHGIGHWLGMDVHDAGAYYQEQKEQGFENGMTLTIEPGLYLPLKSKLPSYWRGLGIRIEDDVQVTRRGHRVLSDKLVKDCKAVEELMAQSLD